jgi:glycosyltransferase involved in cell wall biosynthesis
MARVLYVTYDGVLEPLGQSQVLAYLNKLAKSNSITLISFEKSAEIRKKYTLNLTRTQLTSVGIRWFALQYHKKPSLPATLYDTIIGALYILVLVKIYNIEIVHARSYLPALMALPTSKILGPKLLFDIRGLWPDERLDAGLWDKNSFLYRFAKKLEKYLLTKSSHIITLTHSSIRALEQIQNSPSQPPEITVIPTCVDLNLFSSKSFKVSASFTLGYVGSVGALYVIRELFECFKLVREEIPNSKLLIINRDSHAFLWGLAHSYGLDDSDVEIRKESYIKIPDQIRRMDAAAAIYKPTYSRLATAPTKLAEYLACGVPCLVSAGCGDATRLIEDRRLGAVLHTFTSLDRQEAIDKLIAVANEPDCKSRCRSTAEEIFSLSCGVKKYLSVYEKLLKSTSGS